MGIYHTDLIGATTAGEVAERLPFAKQARRNFPTELIIFSEVLRIHLHQFLPGATFHRITIGGYLDGVYDLSLRGGWFDLEGFSARFHAS
jgi:hypothetical protein